jgi:catechol 2,3-dioxygenase-like lactoylglutathione lyase family enzyme
MIDHVSLGVKSLAASHAFYDAVLAPLGYSKLIVHEATTGYGKTYPEFWLNLRENRVPARDNGTHVCLRARDQATVDAFYAAALKAGAEDAGSPGFRPEYHPSYYAAFIVDLDQNVVEVVTFVREGGHAD